jgi:hypothetical protein
MNDQCRTDTTADRGHLMNDEPVRGERPMSRRSPHEVSRSPDDHFYAVKVLKAHRCGQRRSRGPSTIKDILIPDPVLAWQSQTIPRKRRGVDARRTSSQPFAITEIDFQLLVRQCGQVHRCDHRLNSFMSRVVENYSMAKIRNKVVQLHQP